MSDDLRQNPQALELAGVDQVARFHRERRLRLESSRGASSFVHIAGDPYALVDELLRLARTGAIAELEAKTHPNRRVSAVVAEARRRWTQEIEGTRQ